MAYGYSFEHPGAPAISPWVAEFWVRYVCSLVAVGLAFVWTLQPVADELWPLPLPSLCANEAAFSWGTCAPKNMNSMALHLGTGSFLSNCSESGPSAKMPGLAS